MKPLATLFAVSALFGLLWTSSAPGPAAQPSPLPSPRATGGWTTGSTGVLGNVTYGAGTHTIDLATTGYYDANLWMVFLDYETLTVLSSATIKFLNHPTRAPVVIRAMGDIVIDGVIDLDGATGHHYTYPPTFAEPGPGGFRGGRGNHFSSGSPSAGFGPGGGHQAEPGFGWEGGTASHANPGSAGSASPVAPTYGSPSGAPLIGGSGGSAGDLSPTTQRNGGGGAGGGAVLIGSDARVRISGSVSARGGYRGDGEQAPAAGYGGMGAGGTIRIASPELDLGSNAFVTTAGGNNGTHGGNGYVRFEVDTDTQADGGPNPGLGGTIVPPPSIAYVLGDFLPQGVPTVQLVSWWDPDSGPSGNWVPISDDPRAVFEPTPQCDVQLGQPGPTLFRIQATNVDIGTPLHVRVAHTRGQAEFLTVTIPVAGNSFRTSLTEVGIDLAGGVSAIQVRAELLP